MVVGYIRVSSKSQTDNNSFEQQEQEIIKRYDNAIIKKESYTGSTMDRPVFNEVFNILKADDVLVVTKLDRLARTVKEGIDIVEKLFDKGVKVHVISIGLLENTAMGKFFLTTLLACYELERLSILERTRQGKEIARQKKGFRDGRPKKYKPKQLAHAIELLNSNTISEVEKLTGISESTIRRELKRREYASLEI